MNGVHGGRKGEQDAVEGGGGGGSEKMLMMTSAVLSLVVEMYVDLAPPHVKSRLFGLLLHYVLLCMCSRVSSVAEGKQLWKSGAEALLSTALTGGTGTNFRKSSTS